MAHLRIGQSLTAVFYVPHLLAQALGAFQDEGLTVELVTAFGGQWALLERGEVDVAIGGPTRNMELRLREGRRIVNFCAALSANTWFLIARQPVHDFSWHALAGRTVIGLADAPQGVCLRWILLQHEVDPNEVEITSGKDTARELEAFRAGTGDYLLHSLHSAAPLLHSGEAVIVQELATPTGPIPWSTYAALPGVLLDRRAEIQAFTRAIARALAWIASQPPSAIADRLIPYFLDWTPARLADVLATYQQLGTWARDALIPRAQWNRYGAMYVRAGALSQPVPYEDLVDASFATSPPWQPL